MAPVAQGMLPSSSFLRRISTNTTVSTASSAGQLHSVDSVVDSVMFCAQHPKFRVCAHKRCRSANIKVGPARTNAWEDSFGFHARLSSCTGN